MAIFAPGPLVGRISGNIGGQNFVQGKSGPYIRKALTRVDKKTQSQVLRRSRFTTVMRGWAPLSAESRAAWNAAASKIYAVNRLGEHTSVSGHQFFTQFNLQHPAPIPVYDSPPDYLKVEPPPIDVVLTASAAGAIEIAWDTPWGHPGGYLSCYAARSVSDKPRTTWPSFKRIWFDWRVHGPDTADITSDFNEDLGYVIEGEVIAVEIGFFDSQYRSGTRTRATTTVVA